MSAPSTTGNRFGFAILGPLRVTDRDDAVPLGGRQQRAVLARLIIAGASGASMEQLADMLWGDHLPNGYATTIQTYISHLRKLLEPGRGRGAPGRVLVTEHGRYRLAVPAESVDAVLFERGAEAGARLLAAGDAEAAAAELRGGLALWRGEVLADLADYEFVAPVAARLNERRLAAIEAEIDCRLLLGRHASVISELDELIAQHPLREQLYRRRILALYRSGRQSDALTSYNLLRRQLHDELGVDPSAPLRQLYQQVLTHDPALEPIADGRAGIVYTYNRLTWTDGVAAPPLTAGTGAIESPYRGLAGFDERDAALFFGREAVAARVLELMSARLDGSGLLVVSGVSGAGKSSLLRAGVLPRVRAKGLAGEADSLTWPCLLLTPTRAPLDELAVAVASLAGLDAATVRRGMQADPAGFALTARQAAAAYAGGAASESAAARDRPRLLLVVDQFEQVFTQCADDRERQTLFTALKACATGSDTEPAAAPVVLVVRADLEARCADYPQLAGAVQDRYLVTAMTERQLRLAITEPAKTAGSHVDDDLVETLLREITTRQQASGAAPGPVSGAGTLPLLSHALDQAWRNRAGDTLTVADYERTGGIEGAVARSAQRAYDTLTAAQQAAARQVFIRLTATSADGVDTAARATRDELIQGRTADEARDIDIVLEAFAAERLLVLAAGTVEISHEALLTAWPLLRDTWLADTHADRIIRSRLHSVARDWAQHERDPSYLYSGSLLESADDTATRAQSDPARHPPLSTTERDFLAASRRALKRRALLWRGIVAALVALVIALASAAAWAFRASHNAAQQRNAAVSGQLVKQAATVGNSDPTIARLESLAAWQIHPSAEARYAMLSTAVLPGVAAMTSQAGFITSIAFSPDGKTMATGGEDGTVWLWDMADRRHVGTSIVDLPDVVTSVAFSPDGTTLAIATDRGAVRFWKVANRRLDEALLLALPSTINAVAFSPDGTTLATGSEDRWVRLWSVSSGQQIGTTLDGHTGSVNSVAFSPDGKTLASGSADRTVRLWNVATHRQIGAALTGHSDFVTSVAFSSDGAIVASGSADSTVLLWDTASHRQVWRPLSADPSIVASVAFSPKTNVLATGSGNGSVQLWDLVTRRPIESRLVSNEFISAIAFSPDGETLATGSAHGTVRLWAGPGYQRIAEPLTGHTKAVTSVAFSPDGRTLASGSADRTVRLWDVATRRPIGKPLAGSYDTVNTVAFGPDGKMLVAGSDYLWLWDVPSRRPIGLPIAAHYGNIRALAFSPDGKLLASAGEDQTVKLWDMVSHPVRARPLGSHTDIVTSVAFGPDGKMLASGSDDHTVQLWDVATGKPIGKLPIRHSTVVRSVALSPDGKTMATGAGDGRVQLWDVATHEPLGTPLFGHTRVVNTVAFSPDGHILASGSDDQTVLLWDVATRQQIGAPLTGNIGFVTSVAFSPDGKILASGGTNAAVQLWNVAALVDPHAYLCALTGRSFTRAEWRTYVPPGPAYRRLCP
jgi:WD40 repeat protein/DNA-binding SARP family transcriptional activator